MSHLHLPDGLLPWWLWVGGLMITLGLVFIALSRLGKERRKLPVVAVMAAVSLVAMNIPLGLPVHMNLAALAGIILGPLFGFLAIFVVNLFNALVGHGGLTMVGINSLLVGSEAIVAGLLFVALGGARRLLAGSAASVLAALLVSTLLVFAVTGVAGVSLEALVDCHEHEHAGSRGDFHNYGFLQTFGVIITPLLAVWVPVELIISLLVVGYVNKVKGGWFARE